VFTRTGIAVVVVALVVVVAGVVVGYPELVGLGAGVGVAPVVARLRARRPPPFTVSRLLDPERVEVGAEAVSVVTVRNEGRRRTRRVRTTETVAGPAVAVDLPSLDAGETAAPVSIPLPADRRGIHVVGPLRFGRPEPFGFTAAEGGDGSTALLTVYPRVHRLAPLGAGATRDLDGPTSDLAREGGIAFHGLRGYVAGDDIRLIDWRATARSVVGDLYVRQHVETVRPDLDVVVDTAAERYDADGFELAMEVAASVAASSIGAMHPVRVRTTSVDPEPNLAAGGAAVVLGPVLDALASLEPGDAAPLDVAVHALRSSEPGHSVVVVSGGVDDAAVVAATEDLRQFARVVVLRAMPGAARADVISLGRATVLTVRTGDDVVRLWNGHLA
jgi:uncharacterized protein (DUF58 family)